MGIIRWFKKKLTKKEKTEAEREKAFLESPTAKAHREKYGTTPAHEVPGTAAYREYQKTKTYVSGGAVTTYGLGAAPPPTPTMKEEPIIEPSKPLAPVPAKLPTTIQAQIRAMPQVPRQETITYIPKPKESWKPEFWERTPLRKHVKEELLQLGGAAEYYLGLGGRLEYKPAKQKIVVAEKPPFPKRETLIFKPPTEAEMTPEQRVEAKITKEQLTTSFAIEKVSKKLQEEYQEKIETRKLPLIEAERQYKKELEIKTEPLIKGFEKKAKEYQKKYGAEVMRISYPLTFVKGAVFGAVTAIAPPVGLTLAGIGLGTTAFKWKETKEMFGAYPREAWTHVGLGIVGTGIGAFGTARAVSGIRGAFVKVGKKPIAPELLIESKVLAGKKTFPTAPISKHHKLFLEKRYGLPGEKRIGVWHTTPKKFAKEVLVTPGKYRPREPPGLAVAPSISPYFFRVTGRKYGLFGLGMKSVLGKSPRALRIYPKGIKVGMPKEPGYAYVMKIKPEIEAKLPLQTLLKQLGKPKHYITWRGETIPLHKYAALGDKIPEFRKPVILGEVLKSYAYSYKSTPFLTPSSVLYSLTSLKYHKPSYKIFYKKPYLYKFPYYKKPPYYKTPITRPYGISRITTPTYPYYPYRPTVPYKPIVPYYPPLTKFPMFPPPPKLLGFPEDKRRKVPKAFRKPVQPTRYVPSLPATILGIVGKRKPYVLPRRPKLGFLPGIRPIIRKK